MTIGTMMEGGSRQRLRKPAATNICVRSDCFTGIDTASVQSKVVTIPHCPDAGQIPHR